MDQQALDQLRHVSRGQRCDPAFWTSAAHALAARLAEHMPRGNWGRDNAPWLNESGPSFNLWMWSGESAEPRYLSWSCVIGGGWSASEDGTSVFGVSASLFLFDGSDTDTRVETADGRSFVEYTYDLAAGQWRCLGWVVDEWGEWAGVGRTRDRRANR